MELSEIDQRFVPVMLNSDGLKKARAVAEGFQRLLMELSKVCPEGRDFEFCKQQLDVACAYAKKALGQRAANQHLGKVGDNESIAVPS